MFQRNTTCFMGKENKGIFEFCIKKYSTHNNAVICYRNSVCACTIYVYMSHTSILTRTQRKNKF